VVLTHRYAEAWTIPHRTPSRSRFVNELTLGGVGQLH
jgi:hypothetical protein